MMWEWREDGTLVSERDESGRYGVVYTGQDVTNTQARRGYEGYPYYGFVSRGEDLPSPTADTAKIVTWGSFEGVMAGIEDMLARWREDA